MARKKREIANFVNASTLVDLTGLSWYRFYKLLKRGIIGPPDALLCGRPAWLRERVLQIGKRIDELESKN
jgi:hypothetical protein